jgi:hypothetical protein
MEVTYFSLRRTGPEAEIEDVVARQIPELFPHPEYPSWTAGSLQVGAGMPDLTIVYGNPQVYALTKMELSDAHILAYLRAVGRARLETIALRVKKSEGEVIRQLRSLIEVEIVRDVSRSFSLIPECKNLLPEIVTIEVKVANWRKALQQAHRNSIFAHRSFVALPLRVAQRVKSIQILLSSVLVSWL